MKTTVVTRHAAGDDDLFVYRDRTAAMLRRYLYVSVQLGRLPSLLGREFFRARVTSYKMSTLEDAVIFAHDMDRCLERVDADSRAVLARVVMQEFAPDEAAKLLGISRRTLERRLAYALDTLSEVLLDRGLLRAASDALPSRKPVRGEGCQVGKIHANAATA